LYSYDVASGAEGTHLVNKYEHRAPVMDVCFGENDDVAFTAGMDWVVNRVNLQTGEFTALSKHAAPVRCVAYSPSYSESAF
jgi:cell cycle arrest protein BUB3